jgi:hypothetical protein
VHEQGTVGVQINRAGERLKHHLDMAPQLPGVQKGDADGRAHRWIVHLKFAAGSDQIRVWLDVPPNEIEGRKPHFDMSRDKVEFDRVRFAKTAITDPWLFDEVMLAESLDDLMAADEIINE